MPQAKTAYYEGQEFHNPNDATAPVLVYRAGKFVPKAMDDAGKGGAPQQQFDDARIQLNDVDAATKALSGRTGGFFNTGAIGALQAPAAGDKKWWGGIPGSPGYNLDKELGTIRSRIMFANLAKMKNNSPNGASGLGSLTSSEGEALRSTVAPLDIGLPGSELRQSLGRVKDATIRQTPGLAEANPYDLSHGEPRANIPRGAYYRDPDGNIRRNDNGDAGNPIVHPANKPVPAPAGWSITRED